MKTDKLTNLTQLIAKVAETVKETIHDDKDFDLETTELQQYLEYEFAPGVEVTKYNIFDLVAVGIIMRYTEGTIGGTDEKAKRIYDKVLDVSKGIMRYYPEGEKVIKEVLEANQAHLEATKDEPVEKRDWISQQD